MFESLVDEPHENNQYNYTNENEKIYFHHRLNSESSEHLKNFKFGHNNEEYDEEEEEEVETCSHRNKAMHSFNISLKQKTSVVCNFNELIKVSG